MFFSVGMGYPEWDCWHGCRLLRYRPCLREPLSRDSQCRLRELWTITFLPRLTPSQTSTFLWSIYPRQSFGILSGFGLFPHKNRLSSVFVPVLSIPVDMFQPSAIYQFLQTIIGRSQRLVWYGAQFFSSFQRKGFVDWQTFV